MAVVSLMAGLPPILQLVLQETAADGAGQSADEAVVCLFAKVVAGEAAADGT